MTVTLVDVLIALVEMAIVRNETVSAVLRLGFLDADALRSAILALECHEVEAEHVERSSRAVARLIERGYAIDHATDHGGTVAVYLEDPDGNGIELSYDRPRATWFDAAGNPVLRNDRIALDEI